MSIRFCTESFITSDVVANTEFSSEQTAFPGENVTNIQRRSKVWRTNGYYEVTSSNQDIVFTEGGGDLTASIATGEYTSTTTFLTAVQTAFNAAAAASITVTRDSNLKINITSDGATFTIKWDDASTTAEDLLGFSNAATDTGALTYVADELRINGGIEYIQWDFGMSGNPDIFCLTGPRNDALKISPTATLTLKGSETDAWDSPSYEQELTYDDEVILLQSDTGLHTEALRYWRLEIQDQNPLGYIEVGAVYLGDYLEFSNGKPQFPFGSQFIDRSKTIFSEGGQTFSEINEVSQQFAVQFRAMTKDEIESFKEAFDEFGISKPFFVVFDKSAVFSTLSNRMVRYCKFQQPPSYSLIRPNYFTLQANLREEL